MKDLKHLIYFESLLADANNELVKQAAADGKKALGYTCYFVPEVLLNLPGCFSVRLRAPGTGSTDIGTYYMTNKTCPFTRSILERSIEGGYNFLSAMMSSETCQMMHRAHEYFDILGLVKPVNPQFFMSMMDVPFVTTPAAYEHYEEQLRKYILQPLSEVYGIDVSEAALRQAIDEHNEICRIITEIGEFRKLENPPITSYEFHVIQLVSECCPQYLVKDMLRETLGEIKTREPDPKPAYRARIVVTGSEVDDPAFTKLLEDCGAYVVADRYCYGSFPGRQEIVLTDGEDALTQVCRWYLQHTECPRQSALHRVQYRNDHVAQLVHDFKADGAIYEQMKFCTYWSYERVIANQIMPRDYGIHILSIDRPYIAGQSGQLRTRVQAFVESLEMKQLRSARKEDN